MNCCVARWKDLDRWVPGGGNDWVCLHTLIPLEDLLTPRAEHVRAKQTLGDWTPITIHFDGSVVPRERDTPFKGAMFAAYPGDLVFSKIDVRNGAIGLIPDSMPQVVVTSEYPVHAPDTRQVEARYLTMLLRTPNFLKLIRTAASGTSGRKRITPETFRAIEIPLPEPKDQRRLVTAYQKALDKAAKLDEQAHQIERDAQREFEAALGLTPPPNLPKRPFQIARFRDIERWSHEGILHGLLSATKGVKEGPPESPLGELIEDVGNGWSTQCATRPARDDEWAILKISAVSSGVFRADQNKALPQKLKPRPALEVHPGDLLITRCNIAHLVGVSALVEATPPRLMLCDKIFRVLFRRDSAICPHYLNIVLKTPDLRQQIEGKVTGTSPTMKNMSKESLKELLVPLPELSVQRELAATWEREQTRAAATRKQAAALRAAAWDEFIAAVFA